MRLPAKEKFPTCRGGELEMKAGTFPHELFACHMPPVGL